MTKKETVQVHVESPSDAGRRFVEAWRRAERGEVIGEEHLSFESWKGLAAFFRQKRQTVR